MKKIDYTHQMWYDEDIDCNQTVTERPGEKMNRRIRKKKGLLKDLRYSQIKEQVFEALDAKESIWEQKTAEQGGTKQEK